MNENVENPVIEQLRLIRSDIKLLDQKLSGRIDSLESKVDGNTGVIIALGRYLHDIDNRVEHIEAKLGIE